MTTAHAAPGSRLATTQQVVARILAVLLLASGLVAANTASAPRSEAADASRWIPGEIISDTVFYDHGTMTAAQIQAFLDAQGANCVPGDPACLKSYRVSTPTMASEPGFCFEYPGAANETAAQIIRKVATACRINPRVLIVLLQKESGLVTTTRPTLRNYQTATGFGCPDTAPCNEEYFGLFNQLYRAARQFILYRDNATRYGYQAGRYNTILYNPNVACGSSPVYIQNQATAALYIYTPYQPNAAALANLYGTGDACSAYGNRNFWRLFTDWFGDPRAGAHLVRTASDATVWLLRDGSKHAIRSFALFTDLEPRLGPVAVVSDATVAGYPTGPDLRNILRNATTGEIAWFADGTRYRFGSCAAVEAWSGAACGASFTEIDADQFDNFPAGPEMTTTVATTSGRQYGVSGGARHEAMNDAARSAAGYPAPGPALADSVIEAVPLGQPVLLSGAVLRDRGSGAQWLVSDGTRLPLAEDVRVGTGLSQLPLGALDAASIALVPAGPAVAAFVRDQNDQTFLLTRDGRVPVPGQNGTGPRLPNAALATLPLLAPAANPYFVMTPGDATVWAVQQAGAGQRRAVPTWPELLAAAGPQPRILVLPASGLAAIPVAGPTLAPGTLVKSPASDEVLFVDGFFSVSHLESFAVAAGLGIPTSVATVDGAVLARYQRTPPLSPVVVCGGTRYAAVGGRAIPRAAGVVDPPAVPVSSLTPSSCSRLQVASTPPTTGPLFFKGSGPAVFVGEGLTRRPITTWDTLLALHGSAPGEPVIVTLSDAALARIPLGPPIS